MSEFIKTIPQLLRTKLTEISQNAKLNELATQVADGQMSIDDVDPSLRPFVEERLKKSPWDRAAGL